MIAKMLDEVAAINDQASHVLAAMELVRDQVIHAEDRDRWQVPVSKHQAKTPEFKPHRLYGRDEKTTEFRRSCPRHNATKKAKASNEDPRDTDLFLFEQDAMEAAMEQDVMEQDVMEQEYANAVVTAMGIQNQIRHNMTKALTKFGVMDRDIKDFAARVRKLYGVDALFDTPATEEIDKGVELALSIGNATFIVFPHELNAWSVPRGACVSMTTSNGVRPRALPRQRTHAAKMDRLIDLLDKRDKGWKEKSDKNAEEMRAKKKAEIEQWQFQTINDPLECEKNREKFAARINALSRLIEEEEESVPSYDATDLICRMDAETRSRAASLYPYLRDTHWRLFRRWQYRTP
jgi:hypothetical protein